MRSGFSDAEIASYRRDGFLAVNDFLDADELAQWCEAITSTVEANARPLTGKNSEMAFTQRMHLRRVDDRVRRLVDDRCIGRLVATLDGVDALRLYLVFTTLLTESGSGWLASTAGRVGPVPSSRPRHR